MKADPKSKISFKEKTDPIFLVAKAQLRYEALCNIFEG